MARAMTTKKRIAILTGGGDVPGLNAVIKSVVYRATDVGYDVLGIRRGWEGLTHIRTGAEPDPDYLRPLDRTNTRTIERTGGTVLHTSRTNPRKMREGGLPPWMDAATRASFAIGDGLFDLTPRVLDNLSALGVDLLVTIGGDDTLSYSQVLVNAGVPLVAIPKTMDNDVQGTEYCIGFSTAITRATEAINRQRTTLGSHERIGVFRIFGRDAGFSARNRFMSVGDLFHGRLPVKVPLADQRSRCVPGNSRWDALIWNLHMRLVPTVCRVVSEPSSFGLNRVRARRRMSRLCGYRASRRPAQNRSSTYL